MKPRLLGAFTCAKRAWRPVGSYWKILVASHTNTISDHYKGLEIKVQVRRFGHHAWRCSIRICNAHHQVLQTVFATMRTTDKDVTRQSALMGAFVEAMTLCDVLVEAKTPVAMLHC